MKLAEALLIRADQSTALSALTQRISRNVLVQEGEEPNEDPKELIKQAFILASETRQLIYHIHMTNAQAILEDGRNLVQLLMLRDEYATHHNIINVAIQKARSAESDRHSRREIKWESVVDIPALQKQLDGISGKLRELNILIQKANWQIDLIEP